MSRSSVPDPVVAVLTDAVAQSGLILESVELTPAGRRRVLRVVVDLPADATGGVGLGAVAEASQAVSEALDSSDVLGSAPYTLEVTSPGVDRPLVERRHWARARGRLVRASRSDGRTVTGRVQEVSDDGVQLDVDGEPQLQPWSVLVRGVVEVEFSRSEQTPDSAGEG